MNGIVLPVKVLYWTQTHLLLCLPKLGMNNVFFACVLQSNTCSVTHKFKDFMQIYLIQSEIIFNKIVTQMKCEALNVMLTHKNKPYLLWQERVLFSCSG